ncbi:uncharacterized protein SCDLUD_000912 [Saccharomycodes ludwigii]|nr:hypothetical protein SCDLUD_000912 [Saccharomycodes ludwigii]KAH3903287.1 hypothetical protein SCDLUD_000912 [Saccharomycodes ludwigii]
MTSDNNISMNNRGYYDHDVSHDGNTNISKYHRKYINNAIITENGILIKNLNDPHNGYSDYSEEDDGDNSDRNSVFETASLISCVTCLSENTISSNHQHYYSSSSYPVKHDADNDSANNLLLSGEDDENGGEGPSNYNINDANYNGSHFDREKLLFLPNNSVIPYSKILDARMVDDLSKLPVESTDGKNVQTVVVDNKGSSDIENKKGNEPTHINTNATNNIKGNINNNKTVIKDDFLYVEITFAKNRRTDLIPKRAILKFSNAEYSKLFFEFKNLSVKKNTYTGNKEKNKRKQGEGKISDLILLKSYGKAKIYKRILIIINPHGGKGRANKLFLTKARPILMASGCHLELKETTYYQEAMKFASTLDIEKYDVVACASGDGIPHEVINGLYQRKDHVKAFNNLCITQIPCGSGNAMSASCHGTSNPSHAALSLIKGIPRRMDLMCVSQNSYRDSGHKLSFLSQTYGIIAESDINTEFIRWIGPSRFELGVTLSVLQRKKYPCDIFVKYAAKNKKELRQHYDRCKKEVRKSNEFINENISILDNNNDNHDNNEEALLDNDDEDEEESQDDDVDENVNDRRLITEENFKLKYELPTRDIDMNEIPEGWEQIDPDLTRNTGIFYVGKMPYIAADTKFFPASLPNDGAMDLVLTDARTPVSRIAPILLSLDKGTHVLQPEVVHSKVVAYRLVPHVKKSVISVDGENFPYEPIQVEILPKVCKVMMMNNGNFIETDFDKM